MAPLPSWFNAAIASPQSLERQRGVDRLLATLERAEDAVDALQQLLQRIEEPQPAPHWHELHGVMLALAGVLDCSVLTPPPVPEMLVQRVVGACFVQLEHDQLRVRQAVGSVIAALAKRHCSEALLAQIGEDVVASIARNFERGDDEDASSRAISEERVQATSNAAAAKAALEARGLRPDAEGWKALETSLSALAGLMNASNTASATQVALVLRASHHRNRFVRQAALDCAAVIARLGSDDDDELVAMLAEGLADNWSQVRLAASVATRAFVQRHLTPVLDEAAVAKLIPGMCLNRYYVAEGVRVYSLDTWKMLVSAAERDGDGGSASDASPANAGGNVSAAGEASLVRDEASLAGRASGGGASLVNRHPDAVVAYYASQARADNHAVREAACYCIAELATKVGSAAMRQRVGVMLAALLDCFRDESWPVRDAACVALGDFVTAFTEEARSSLAQLVELWTQHLADNIASVRRNSAAALGKAMRAYGSDLVAQIDALLQKMLPEARQQPPDQRRPPTTSSTGRFGVVHTRRSASPDDDAAHTDQVMYSCGSLAPKLRRGGGCMDHGFRRAKQPWESSDGAVYLLVELAAVDSSAAEKHMATLADLTELNAFSSHAALKESVFSSLWPIAQHLGKRVFKRHLPLFVDALLNALDEHQQRLAQHAAALTIERLCSWLSPSIFMFRLSHLQQQRLRACPLVHLPPQA